LCWKYIYHTEFFPYEGANQYCTFAGHPRP
jgi:hypothetical protein